MISINLVGFGFLDIDTENNINIKKDNQLLKFGSFEIERSLSFDIPLTDNNKQLLGFSNSVISNGDVIRETFDAQISISGIPYDGIFCVLGVEKNKFKCVFVKNIPQWQVDISNTKLSTALKDVKGWNKNIDISTTISARQADFNQCAQNLEYRRSNNTEQHVSINFWKAITDSLSVLAPNITLTEEIDKNNWLILDKNYSSQLFDTSFYFSKNIYSYVITGNNNNVISLVKKYIRQKTGLGSFSYIEIKIFYCNTKLTIDLTDTNLYGKYIAIGSGYYDKKFNKNCTYSKISLDNHSFVINEGELFFFCDKPYNKTSEYDYYGHTINNIFPLSNTSMTVEYSSLDLSNNINLLFSLPDMTVFDFINNYCIAAGLDFIIEQDGIFIKNTGFGKIKNIDNIVELQKVNRTVSVFGENVSKINFSFLEMKNKNIYCLDVDINNIEVNNNAIGLNSSEMVCFDVKCDFSLGFQYNVFSDFFTTKNVYVTDNVLTLCSASGGNYLNIFTQNVSDINKNILSKSTAITVSNVQNYFSFENIKHNDLFVFQGKVFCWTGFICDISNKTNNTIYLQEIDYYNKPEQNTILITTNNLPNNAGYTFGGGRYNIGDFVTISAFSENGYEFVEWKKGGETVSTNNTYSFTATENATYTAYFNSKYYTINVFEKPTGSGVVLLEGNSSCPYGATTVIKAYDSENWVFKHWLLNEEIVSLDRDFMVTFDSNKTYYGVFEEKYNIQAYPVPNNLGIITGAGYYSPNEQVILVANIIGNSRFIGWYEGSEMVSQNQIYSFLATESRILQARFEQQESSYMIQLVPNNSNYGYVQGAGSYIEGQQVRIGAFANTGYEFVRWENRNGGVFSTQAVFVFAAQQDLDLVAVFKAQEHIVSITKIISGGGSTSNPGSVSGAGTYSHGTTVTLTATPNTGYRFIGWRIDGETVSTNTTYRIVVNSDLNIDAVFAINSSNVNINLAYYNTYQNAQLFLDNEQVGTGQISVSQGTHTLSARIVGSGTFLGWYKQNAGSSTTQLVSSMQTITVNITSSMEGITYLARLGS